MSVGLKNVSKVCKTTCRFMSNAAKSEVPFEEIHKS